MRRLHFNFTRALLIAVSCLPATLPTRLPAQGWIDPVRPSQQLGVKKVSTHVEVRVNGRIATVEVDEQFRNDGGQLGESDYIYPLPGEAVFSNFSLFQGEQELRGETMTAERARQIYEEIVRRKRDPALIELAGHGMLRARVFPIAPGETRRITLRYTQVLNRSGDALQFKYAAGQNASLRMMVENGSRFGQPFSPTHEVRVLRGERITVTPVGKFAGDFDLFLPLRSSGAAVTVATHRSSSEDGFFMLTLSPAQVTEAAAPRDITAVVDVSGSMSGEKISQARAALHSLLASLSPRDRFRLIAFSDQVRSYNQSWLSGTRESIRAADEWIDNLRAEGGTNIAGALEEAFRANSSSERVPFVVFVTDGLPSIGESNPERIADMAEHARGRTRVFAFGVGYDVNTYLLDRLGAAARGSTQYVKPRESVERAIGTLANRIRFPVLTDLRITNTPVRIDDVYPRHLPDLFAGEELIILGRYSGSGDGEVSVVGRRSGRGTERALTNAEFKAHELGNDFIPKLWAARKVGFLSQQLRLRGHNQELTDELRETALRYGVLSEYTSYLVQEAPPPAAAVPTAATGRGAVLDASKATLRLEAKSVAAANQVAAEEGLARVTNAADIDEKLYDVVKIEPFSEAYFAMLRALPELKPFWRTSANATVDGKNIRIKLTAGGVTRLEARRITEIVKKFRT